jgi:hypothetical protein
MARRQIAKEAHEVFELINYRNKALEMRVSTE